MSIVDILRVLMWLCHTLCGIVCAKHSSVLGDLFLMEKRPEMTSSGVEEYRHRHGHSGSIFPTECCPSVTQGIAPLGGLSRDGALLQLYRDSSTIQKFYETTCAHGVRGRACHFIDQSRYETRCEQKYSYTYAIVKDFNVTEPYRIDYMKIKTGCTCSIRGRRSQHFSLTDLIQQKKKKRK
ncbi:hypothetical protein ACF0H5_013235 [Mactra antiquata]